MAENNERAPLCEVCRGALDPDTALFVGDGYIHRSCDRPPESADARTPVPAKGHTCGFVCLHGYGPCVLAKGHAARFHRLADGFSFDNCEPFPSVPAAKEETRIERQVRISTWCAAAFGAGHASSVPQRAVRLLEESIEAYQAAECGPAMAHRLVDYVFSRPAGTLSQELGGVGVTLLALAQAAGCDADAAEVAEIARVTSNPLAHFAARNEAKNAAGFDVTVPAAKEETMNYDAVADACIAERFPDGFNGGGYTSFQIEQIWRNGFSAAWMKWKLRRVSVPAADQPPQETCDHKYAAVNRDGIRCWKCGALPLARQIRERAAADQPVTETERVNMLRGDDLRGVVRYVSRVLSKRAADPEEVSSLAALLYELRAYRQDAAASTPSAPQNSLNCAAPASSSPTPVQLARRFHEAYERLAPVFNYGTRRDTRAFDPESPNGRLMIATCAEILASTPVPPAPAPIEKIAETVNRLYEWSIAQCNAYPDCRIPHSAIDELRRHFTDEKKDA